MTVIEFGQVVGALAVATGRTMDDETTDVYYAGLRDIPGDVLRAAVGRLVKSESFFPSVGRIRAACDLVGAGGLQRVSVPALPASPLADDDPRVWYFCPVCSDQGWASHWCPGSVGAAPGNPVLYLSVQACGSTACQRFRARGYGHEYVRRCSCYATNPQIRQRLESRRSYSEGTA